MAKLLIIRLSVYVGVFLYSTNLHTQQNIDFQKEMFKSISTKSTNEDNRATAWLLGLHEMNHKIPETPPDILTIFDQLITDDYPYKVELLKLTKVSINKLVGYDKANIEIVEEVFKSLTSVTYQSIIEKKLLSIACITYVELSKYTGLEKRGLVYGYQGLELAKVTNFTEGQLLAHYQIGQLIDRTQNDYTLALKHFASAKKLLRPLSNTLSYMKPQLDANIATIWAKIGDIQKSNKLYLRILKETQEIANPNLLNYIHSNLGKNYYELKQYGLSEKHLEKALAISKKHQKIENKVFSLLQMSYVQLAQSKLTAATNSISILDTLFLHNPLEKVYLTGYYQLKSRIAKINNDFKNALFWMEKAKYREDSLYQQTTSKNILQQEELSNYKEIQRTKILLQQENKLHKATIKNKKLLLSSLVTLALLSLMFGIILYKKKNELTKTYDFILAKKKPLVTKQRISYHSNLPPTEKKEDALKYKIIHALEQEKLFLQQDLTLDKFANYLHSNTSYVSKTINGRFGKNFNTLINEYRINEILTLFEANQYTSHTIDRLSKQVGFRSNSAFQKAFKKNIGITPTNYLQTKGLA